MNRLVDQLRDCYGRQFFKVEDSWFSDRIILEILPVFREDYSKYYSTPEVDWTKVKYFPGLLATLFYRFARKYYLENEESTALEFSTFARYITGIELYYSSDIGTGLKINHGSGLVVGARSKLGQNCTLHQNVTIGDRLGGRPKIGNNVTIFPGSSVLGAIEIGDGVIIGANTLVIQNIKSDTVVYGTPNRLKNA